jgi:hypothetical protein
MVQEEKEALTPRLKAGDCAPISVTGAGVLFGIDGLTASKNYASGKREGF